MKITIVDPDSIDYTEPPEGLARPARRRWQRLFRDFREQYDMPPDLAWFRACQVVFPKGR